MTTLSRQGATEPEVLSPLSIIRMLWKWRVLIVLLSAVLSVISAVVVLRMRPQYKADALVLVDTQKIPEKFVSSTVSSDASDRLASISQQIMSTTRLLKIIKDLDLYREERKSKAQEEIVEQMRRDISLKVEKDTVATGKPVAFRVGYQGTAPVIVAEVANQLANLYIEENLQTREVEAAGTSEFIDNQLAQAKRELDDEEQKVARFKQEHNGILPEQENPLLSTLSNLRVQLQGVQDSANRAQQNKLMLDTAISTEESTEANLERSFQLAQARVSAGGSPEVAGTVVDPQEKAIAELERRLQELRSRYTPDHPDVIAAEAQLAEMKQADEAERQQAKAAAPKPSTAGAVQADAAALPVPKELLQERGKIAMLKTQLASVKRDIEFQETERERIVSQISANQSRVEQLPLVEQQMAGLTRDYETSKANYKSLLDKKIAAEMATDMERRQKSERFEIIDPARVPEKPFKPNRPVWLGVGVLLSLALSVAVAFGLEFKKGVLLGDWELPAEVAVLGRVPVIVMNEKTRRGGNRRVLLAVCSAAASLVLAAFVYYVVKIRS